MKILSTLLIGLLIAVCWIAKGEEFTIADFTASASQDTNGFYVFSTTNTISVSSNQVIDLISFLPIYTPGYVGDGFVMLQAGETNQVWLNSVIQSGKNLRFVGPITLRAVGRGVLTYRIESKEVQPLPSTSVVIPSDATGPVEIKLESSSDLVNWQDALPGIYGATTTNRFFRVRAIRQ